MSAKVEGASIKHLERLYEIERECFVEEAFTKRQIAQLLTDYSSVSLIAREDDQIVGFITGVIYADKKVFNGHILTIDVSASHRRKGIGQMLLSRMEALFVQKGVHVCVLEVREDNVPAMCLYRKLGYAEAGRLQNYYGKAHGIYLKKMLA
jgi:ribosomal-protein-alanine N-acetyltransferase